MLAAWDGYISIALLVDDYAHAVAQGMHVLSYQGRPVPAPERVTLSIIEDRGYRAPVNRFPYNMLRNVALRGCEAEYVMAADVDFVPLPVRPSRTLRRHLAALEARGGAPVAVVLAAFEQVQLAGAKPMLPHDASGLAPMLNKVQLQAMVGSGKAIGFASNVYEMGHKCDRAAQFFGASQPYETQYEFGCEPYTIVPRATAHLYDERFVGYGKDRVSWNYELAAKGATFTVLPDVFLVHFNTYDEPKKESKCAAVPRTAPLLPRTAPHRTAPHRRHRRRLPRA